MKRPGWFARRARGLSSTDSTRAILILRKFLNDFRLNGPKNDWPRKDGRLNNCFSIDIRQFSGAPASCSNPAIENTTR